MTQVLKRRGGMPTGAFAITPGASALSSPTYGGILVGGAGTVTVTTLSGQTGVVITAVAGQHIPLVCTHVTAAAASGLVGLY